VPTTFCELHINYDQSYRVYQVGSQLTAFVLHSKINKLITPENMPQAPSFTSTFAGATLLLSTLFDPATAASLLSRASEVSSGHPAALSGGSVITGDSVHGVPASLGSSEAQSYNAAESLHGRNEPEAHGSSLAEVKLTLPDGTVHSVRIDLRDGPLMDELINPLLASGVPVANDHEKLSTNEIRQASAETLVTEADIQKLLDLANEQESELANINTKLDRINLESEINLWLILPTTSVAVAVLGVSFWAIGADVRKRWQNFQAGRAAARTRLSASSGEV